MTSLRHLAHLWIAVLVKLIRKGIRIRLRIPNKSMERKVNRYPIRLGWYSTIELETASQKGHFTFVDLW